MLQLKIDVEKQGFIVCLFPLGKKKKQQPSTKYQGGGQTNTSNSLIRLLFVRDGEHENLRVINQCELSRFIVVKVHLCQATLCWYWAKKKCSIFINHLSFLCLICKAGARRGGILVCAELMLYNAETLAKDIAALWTFSTSLFKLLMRVEAISEHWWSFIQSYVLHCSCKCVFKQV